MEQYKVAVDVVQDHVYDVNMAKASQEELEALHCVLQADGLAGIKTAVESLELQALDRAFAEEGSRAAKRRRRLRRRRRRRRRRRGTGDSYPPPQTSPNSHRPPSYPRWAWICSRRRCRFA